MFIRLDFPAPEGPIMAVSSPEMNSPFILCNSVRFPEKNTVLIEEKIKKKIFCVKWTTSQ